MNRILPVLFLTLPVALSACQPIRLSTDALGVDTTDAPNPRDAVALERFGPFEASREQVWIDGKDEFIYATVRVEGNDASITTEWATSTGARRVRSVQQFVRLETGAIALKSVERPGDDIELRFDPPLILIPESLTTEAGHEHSVRAIATRESGKDRGSGTARATTTLNRAADGATAGDALTINVDVDFGMANWARRSVQFMPDDVNGPTRVRAQEQLRVLSVLIRDDKLIRVE